MPIKPSAWQRANLTSAPFSVRRLVAVAVLATLGLGVLAPGVVSAQDGVPPTEDRLRAFAVEVPGQCGHLSTTPPAEECPHLSDQLETYASLVKDEDVADAELSKYFHSMQFGPGEEIESEYSPADGVTVYRDALGVPHLYADSLNLAAHGLGYVTAEDRLFEMDVFRHAARGTLTEFIGDDEEHTYLQMDIATRREGYTQEEVEKMFDRLDDKFGATGKQVQEGLEAYAAGVNQYIEEARTDPRKLPVEYGATFNAPEEWTPIDTLFVVVLQLRVFGETAGDEIQNAGLFAHLTKKLGKKLGRAVYNDFAFQNDPKSPTSLSPADANFRTQPLRKVNFRSVAIPDNAVEVANSTLSAERSRERVLASMGFRAPASNALLVSGEESATGNPLQIGAPQVGYAVPSFFMEIDVHAPGVDFRGPAVPGASALIPLGRGRDYAWSLTTGFSDAVDTRAEKLCEPEGGKPTLESEGYLFKGKCRKMESREESFIVKPTAANPGPPAEETRTFYRTIHGPVFARALVNEKPVAFVKHRFFWKREVDSIPQFARWNTQVDSIEDFTAAAKRFTMSFNAFYADAENIGYYHVGFYPRRARGVHPSLPIWGTGRWEWKGRRSFAKQPHLLNPDKGWVANWNNKPTKGWKNNDSAKWGSVHRAQLLEDKMHRLLDGPGKATLSDLVDVIRESATQDTRGLYLGPKMLRMAAKLTGADPKYYEALELVRKWVKTGAHRHNQNDDDEMDQGPALAIFDAWYTKLVHQIFDDELGTDGYELVRAPLTDYVPAEGSNFWFDFSSYVKNLFDARARKRFALNYCDDRTTKRRKEACSSLVVSSLMKALKDLEEDQGANIADWTVPREDIVFQELGGASVPPIPWQNRGTHNHVVEILSDAGPIAGPTPGPSATATP